MHIRTPSEHQSQALDELVDLLDEANRKTGEARGERHKANARALERTKKVADLLGLPTGSLSSARRSEAHRQLLMIQLPI